MLKSLWKIRNVSMEAKVGMFEGIVEPSLLYGCKTWVTNKSERKKIEAVLNGLFEEYMWCEKTAYGCAEEVERK